MVYVDNPWHTRDVLRTCLPTLGKDLHPGDDGVKWDVFHILQLLRETTRSNHPSISVGAMPPAPRGEGRWCAGGV